MTISLVASDATPIVAGATTLTLNSTEGNLQVCYVTHRSASQTPTITGDGWSAAVLIESEIANTSARRAIAMFWRVVPAGQSTDITLSWSGTPNRIAFGYEYNTDTAGGTWSFDGTNNADNGTTAGTSLGSNAVTPANAEAVAVAGLVARNGDVAAEDSYSDAFITGVSASSGVGVNELSGFSGYKIVDTTPAAMSTTASWTTSALATALIGVWSVDKLPQNPYGRYRASTTTPGALASWADEGSGGNNLVQATGSAQPTAEATGFNGLPSVLFDGIDDFMQTAAYAVALSQPNTIVIMGEPTSVPDTGAHFVFDGISGGRHSLINDSGLANDPLVIFAGGSARVSTLSLVGMEGTDVCIVNVFNDPANSTRLSINDGTPFTAASPGPDSLAGLTIASRFNGVELIGFRFVEILAYARDLTAQDITNLQAYFVDTYQQTPAGEVVTLDGTLPALTADFSVTAEADTQLDGTLPALTADFSIQAEADVQLDGTLPALSGSFDIATPGSVTLTGVLPALVGTFDVDASANAQLAGILPALTGNFDVTVTADITLTGMLGALIGSFDIGATSDVELAGVLPALEGSFIIVTPGTVVLTGVLPALQGEFLIGVGAGPPDGPHTLRAIPDDHSLRAIDDSHTLVALQ